MNYIFTLPKMLTTFVITIFIDDSLSMQLRIIINNIAKFMADLFEPFISFRTYQCIDKKYFCTNKNFVICDIKFKFDYQELFCI